MSFSLTADMRYIGQEYYVNVDISEPFDLNEINNNFHKTYEKQYGHSTPEGPSEFINLRLIATGKIKKTDSVKSLENDKTIKASKRKIIFNQKEYETKIYARYNIRVNESFEGPAVIEESTATTVIPPNYSIIKDEFGNIVITKDKS